MFTPIHRLLGLSGSTVDCALFDKACAEHVAETDDLDWKQDAYDTRDPGHKFEFAKDVAAMANIGGGWIVLGVQESAEHPGQAESLCPVVWDEHQEQRLTSWAYQYTSPRVFGLEFIRTSVDGGFVVMIRVPALLDRPIFALTKTDGQFRAPIRDGSHTRDMGTFEIDREFRARYQRAGGLDQHVDRLLTETTPADATCLRAVFAAVPHEPRTRPLPDWDTAATCFDNLYKHLDIDPPQLWIEKSLFKRPGLRRWINPLPACCVELHADGSVTVATDFSQCRYNHRLMQPPAGDGSVPNADATSDLVEFFLDNAIAMTVTYARQIGANSLYRAALRVVQVPNTSGHVHKLFEHLPGSGFDCLYCNHTLPSTWTDVRTDFDPQDDVDQRYATWQLALDALNQAGLDGPLLLKKPEDNPSI